VVKSWRLIPVMSMKQRQSEGRGRGRVRVDEPESIRFIHKTIVPQNNTSNGLLEFVINAFPGVKRTTAKQWLSHDAILVNDNAETKFDFEIFPGDVIMVRSGKATSSTGGIKFGLPLGTSILFEDEHIIVLTKPAKLPLASVLKPPPLSVSERPTSDSSLLGHVNKYLGTKKQKALIVHQMDADSSGLVVLAKSALAKDFLQKNWNSFGRTFVCVCHGYLSPMHGVWTTYHDERGERVKTYSASPKSEGGSGKLHLAVTNFRTIETSAGSQDAKYSLVELSLQTNRRDQIRSQFALMNHPIVGDHLYNEGQDNKTGNARAARLALHASELRFVHPVTRESLTLSSQVPPALTGLLGTSTEWNAEIGIGIGKVGDVQGSEGGGRNIKVFGLEEWLDRKN